MAALDRLEKKLTSDSWRPVDGEFPIVLQTPLALL
jgi:hypothetical protein